MTRVMCPEPYTLRCVILRASVWEFGAAMRVSSRGLSRPGGEEPLPFPTPLKGRQEAIMARIQRRVEEVLRQNEGAFLCCDCIAAKLGGEDRKVVHRVTSALSNGAHPEISKYRGTCSICGAEALVTRQSASPIWA